MQGNNNALTMQAGTSQVPDRHLGAAHVPQARAVVVGAGGPDIRGRGAGRACAHIVAMPVQPRHLLAGCHVPVAHLGSTGARALVTTHPSNPAKRIPD